MNALLQVAVPDSELRVECGADGEWTAAAVAGSAATLECSERENTICSTTLLLGKNILTYAHNATF